MAYDVLFTSTFELEYRATLIYLVDIADGPSAAVKLMDALDNLISILSDTPDLKAISTKPALAQLELREFLVRNYIVLYRVIDDAVFLEHIFHTKQDYEQYI